MFKHILVADNDTSVLLEIKRILQEAGFKPSAGYKIITAHDGNEAILKLTRLDQHRQLDLVIAIVDVVMPGCDGFQLTNWLRNKHFGVPVIMVTGAPVALQNNMPDHIIEKPFRDGEIQNTVTACVHETLGLPPRPLSVSAICA